MIPRISSALLAGLTFFTCIHNTLAKSNSTTQWITYQSDDDETVYLADDRRPALYTGNFGDCLGDSSINVTRFDAAYYKDNMTVLFHLEGSSALANESLMMYIGVYAYGENRFDLTFNPCEANIASLCPANSSVPIEATGIIPVSSSDVSVIPAIALTIPDFEGEAILRIFANSTQSEIACYSASLTNGNTFSQPTSVGTVLGVFTIIALLASFVTAAYGEAVPTMRLHYAHSLSVGVVFAVFQHIYFTGALSMNWPSVLVAWWSNFAWAGGMIYSSTMQTSINNLIGNNVGNTSQVGAASSGSSQESLGGGYDISLIYKRALASGAKRMADHPLLRDVARDIYRRPASGPLKRDLVQRSFERTLQTRDLVNSSTGYTWYGHPVGAGLPLPGNYSGFAGTLAQEGIRASNAFMTGFLWFLILLVILVAALMAFKWFLEGLARMKTIKQERFEFFRNHWLGYSGVLALRICYLAFFMMMFLTIFQFTYESSGGVKAVAAIVFIVFLLGMSGAAVYACLEKGKLDMNPPSGRRTQVERNTLLGKIPWFGLKKAEPAAVNEEPHEMSRRGSKGSSRPFWKKRMSSSGSVTDPDRHLHSIHDNEDYTAKFGWLAARFRRTRWWFFTVWIFYELMRAIFYGGASGYPLVQVFGILIIEFVAFLFILWAKPFEGRRLNLLVVYCLGFSKVTSVALSAAFDVQFDIARIPTTVIGIGIIIIQGILTIITLIAIIVGAISSYMSISRNREDFRPRKWTGLREKYFNHLDRAVNDVPQEPKTELPEEPEESKYGFEMKSVRRLAKIEDEDPEFATEIRPEDPAASYLSLDDRVHSPQPVSMIDGQRSGAGTPGKRSRAPSVQSISQTNLPFGARSHRPSWSTRDFSEAGERLFTPVDMTRDVDDDEPIAAPAPIAKDRIAKSPARSSTLPNPKLRQHVSNDRLSVGGDVSTRDTIGMVPAPTMRPRAGTFGSTRSYSNVSTWNESSDRLGDIQDAYPNSQRVSRAPLTPAQEQEEFGLVRGPSANQ
ncbi:hypothetical protein LTR36_010040 [Oleoguttula mirabilis]|uniref:ML-like domain-containing protein n=1 Tax=Oleoguttula mirabilis TaxID=1507867 RepID=A0AAV9JRZ7_9PEZI|nr:hypothetical protein LTR36_010040 [Oleoguttula mirabilis]